MCPTWDLPDYQQEAMERTSMCLIITERARNLGLDTNPAKVNRQFRAWLRWYRGQLATGYLIRVTGVKRIASQ
jgi:hypothetical protein